MLNAFQSVSQSFFISVRPEPSEVLQRQQ